MAKSPRKIALINVADYPKSKYSAYWDISVNGDDDVGYFYNARIVSYTPISWLYKGERTENRPNVAGPKYPAPPKPTGILSVDKKNADDFRKVCAEEHASCPVPVHVAYETGNNIDDPIAARDDADTVAQEWVLSKIEEFAI